MVHRVLMVGLVGSLALSGGCGSATTGGSSLPQAPAPSATAAIHQDTLDEDGPTKLINLSITGMT